MNATIMEVGMLDIREAGQAVNAFRELLDRTPDAAAHVRVAPDAWTLAEIVGHLIDSAGNNHQRFVRLSFGSLEGFPGYEAEQWVRAQGYDRCDFRKLCALWLGYNELLLHLAGTLPRDAMGNAWSGPEGPVTLGFLLEDYYRHLRLHTERYDARLREVLAGRR
ncbi:MAG: DinB family protein [Thermodesulfobacteriota bacterium]